MAKPLSVKIKESLKELSQLRSKQPPHLKSRIQMLILLKRSGPMSKIQLADALGVNHNSANDWRKAYLEGGLERLLQYERGGNKSSVIPQKAHQQMEKRLNNPEGAFRSYKELQQWIDEHFVPGIKYTTVNEYAKRHFGTKLKIARKTHILKDEQAGKAFLKNR